MTYIDNYEKYWQLAWEQNSNNTDKAIDYATKALDYLSDAMTMEPSSQDEINIKAEALYIKGQLYHYGVTKWEDSNVVLPVHLDSAKKFYLESSKLGNPEAEVAYNHLSETTEMDYIQLKMKFEDGDLEAAYDYANKHLSAEWHSHERFDVLLANAEAGHVPSMLATAQNFKNNSGTPEDLSIEDCSLCATEWESLANESLKQRLVSVAPSPKND